MNRLLRICSAIVICAICMLNNQKVSAQLVGTEAFLQGDYVEVGIATNGAFGTDGDAPSTYHPRGVGLKLGFVADPDKDGWAVGTPNYIGDYFLPGSPQEGWDMQLNGVWAQAWRGAGGTSMTGGLTGSTTTYTVTGSVKEGLWEGTLGALRIQAKTKLKKDKLYFTTTVKLVNTGTTTLYDFYYDRTVDPDQEVPTPGGGSFTTDNKIIYALPNAGNRTLVTGIGTSSIRAYLGLASRDCRAKPYIVIGGLTPTDSLNKLYSGNSTTNAIFKLDSLHTADAGIGIVFKIDSLRAGDSTQLSYAYILSTADIDSAFDELKPVLNVGGKPYLSGDTLYACNGSTLDVNIVNADYYLWHWSPTTGLSDTVGSRTTITVGTTPITYTVNATSSLCAIDPVKVTVIPIINPNKPVVTTPVYYCQFDPAKPLTATPLSGSTLKWYTAASGGPALTSITPATNIVGSKYYYVSQISGALCESGRERIEVITRALPRIDSVVGTNPSFCSASDGKLTIYTDSANTSYTLTYDKNGSPVTPITILTNALKKYTITGLPGASYSNFVVKNSSGCLSVPFYGPVILKDPTPPGPPIFNNGPLCVGETLNLTAPLITGATYTWTGPNGFTSSAQNPSFVIDDKAAGVYTLVIAVGPCIYTPSRTTLVITPTPKKQRFNSLYKICEGSNLIVDLVRETGVTYVWNGTGLMQLNQSLSIPYIKASQSGAYTLTASNDQGCITMDTANVFVDTRLNLIMPKDTAICVVDSAVLNVITNASAVLWRPSTGLSDTSVAQIKARPTSTTTYTLLALSNGVCPDTSGTVKVTVLPTPKVLGFDTLVRMNIPYTILPTYGSEVIRWNWIPADSLSCAQCPNPVFNSSKRMQYIVYAADANGCVGSDTVTVNVFCDGANVTMPNAFTPNGDGRNDIFYVRGTGFTVKSFSVYNRLGQQVFTKENFLPNDQQYGWDGTFNGQAISDAAGFVYVIEVICLNSTNDPLVVKGSVLMIK